MSGTDHTLKIRVDRVSQLFNMLDPDPFRERDLDPAAEAYITEWADELPPRSRFKFIIQLPQAEVETDAGQELEESLRHYFRDRAQGMTHELKALFRTGRIALLIALVVLALCLVAAQQITAHLSRDTFSDFVSEGLIILGWVALWRPLEIFLYDWWPILRKRNLYRRIAEAHIEVKETAAKGHDGKGHDGKGLEGTLHALPQQ